MRGEYSKELALYQWKQVMREKDRLVKTGCHNGHCYHGQSDPKCKFNDERSALVYKCCRCNLEGK